MASQQNNFAFFSLNWMIALRLFLFVVVVVYLGVINL